MACFASIRKHTLRLSLFFISSNKEKVTKKACPKQGQGETFLLSFSTMRKKVSKERIAPLRFSFILIPSSL